MLGMAGILLLCVFFSLLYRPPPVESVEPEIGSDVTDGLTTRSNDIDTANPTLPQEPDSEEDEKKDTITNFCPKFDRLGSSDPKSIRIARVSSQPNKCIF